MSERPDLLQAPDRAGKQTRRQRQAGVVWLRAGGANVPCVHGQVTAPQLGVLVFPTGRLAAQDPPSFQYLQKGEQTCGTHLQKLIFDPKKQTPI